MNPTKLYSKQKSSARHRGIEFILSFEEWYNIWLNSGYWHLRGKGKGTYVMSRIGDTGPYEIGNVFIQSNSDNVSEAKKGKTLSEEHCRKISEAQKGKSRPPRSEETCRKISEAAKNRYKKLNTS